MVGCTDDNGVAINTNPKYAHTTDAIKTFLERNAHVVQAFERKEQPIFVIKGLNWAWSANDKVMQLQSVWVANTPFVTPFSIDCIGTIRALGPNYFNKVLAMAEGEGGAAAAVASSASAGPPAKRRVIVGGRIISVSGATGGAADDGEDDNSIPEASVLNGSDADTDTDDDEFDEADYGKKTAAKKPAPKRK